MVPCVVALLLLARVLRMDALDISQCIAPLGMESGLIPDRDLSASSSFNDGNVGPQNARLNQDIKSGAWCPKSQITTESAEWLEVDLRAVHVVTGAGTQGRFGNAQGAEFAEAYVLEYWRPRLGKWVRYRTADGQEILPGNTNTYLEKKNHLEPPIWASKIRFIPYSSHRRTVCMRVELYGCYWSVGIVSYSMPKGDKRSNGVELTDAIYDGQWGAGAGAELRGGLGQLVDGRTGGHDIREAARAPAWVGWRNDSRPHAPAITFEFDRVREFSAVHLYCNNKFMRDVQVFSEAIISFSIGGRHFQDEPIRYTPVEDNIFESSRNVSIKLHHRIGKWVRIELHFSARWILISEVLFDSDVAQGNYTPETLRPAATGTAGAGAGAGAGGGAGADAGEAGRAPARPVSTARPADALYLAVLVGVLTALALLLGAAVLLVVHRHRHRKCFASPLQVRDAPLPPAADADVKADEYQEPYQALPLTCAPYFSYSTVLLEMKDFVKDSNAALSDSSNYDYAVPELSSAPLLNKRRIPDNLSDRVTEPMTDLVDAMDMDMDTYTRRSLRSDRTRSPSQQEVLLERARRLECVDVIEFPRHRLRMISKLAEGAFGPVYVAEADGVPAYDGAVTAETRLVAVKFLCHDADDNDKYIMEEFECCVRALASLSSPHLARVLGACRSPPRALVLEYCDRGDLCAFLRASPPAGVGVSTLLHIATQIAAGMHYLETLNFVHRDLAARLFHHTKMESFKNYVSTIGGHEVFTLLVLNDMEDMEVKMERNCLISKDYQIKISDFGADNEAYASDYCALPAGDVVPLRWAAWERVLGGAGAGAGDEGGKADVWAYAVTLHEVFTWCRRRPYEHLSDAQVLDNLARLRADDGRYELLPRAPACPRDLHDLMLQCWRREPRARPSFARIHAALQRRPPCAPAPPHAPPHAS